MKTEIWGLDSLGSCNHSIVPVGIRCLKTVSRFLSNLCSHSIVYLNSSGCWSLHCFVLSHLFPYVWCNAIIILWSKHWSMLPSSQPLSIFISSHFLLLQPIIDAATFHPQVEVSAVELAQAHQSCEQLSLTCKPAKKPFRLAAWNAQQLLIG